MRGIEQYLQVDAATLGALKYAGTWNASTNTPTLTSSVGTQGQYYVVSVAGSTNLDGETAWQVGDWAVFNGSVWQKVDGGSTGLLTTLTVTGNTYLATTSGSVGIGTTTPSTLLNVYSATNATATIQGDAQTIMAIERYSTDSNSPTIAMRKYRGTLASKAAVTTGDTMGTLNFVAYGGTNNRVIGQIVGFVESYVSDTNISSYFGFNTTPAGSVSPVERMRLDSAGNLGLGVTPSAWGGSWKMMQFPYGASFGGLSGNFALMRQNAFGNGANDIYIATAAASDYYQSAGSHVWRNAPSGTAGNAISFTQAMTLNASGDLLVGRTSLISSEKFSSVGYALIGSATHTAMIGEAANELFMGSFTNHAIQLRTNNTERARITSDGSLGIGGTSFGSGALVMFIANATTAPTTDPTGGGILYVESGALKYRGSSGTVTTIANA